MMKKRNNRGFSIVEAVIALSVVVLVSACALSIVLSSINSKKAAVDKTYAQNFANSALESFKCHPKGDFAKYLAFAEEGSEHLTIVTEKNGDKKYTSGSFELESRTTDNTTVFTYVSQAHSFTAEITIQYGYDDGKTDTFEIVVTGTNGKQLVTLDYEKPASSTITTAPD